MRPMLAATLKPDLQGLTFPMLLSPKLDGYRCVLHEGSAYSKNMMLFPNIFVQAELKGLSGLDGELIVGDPHGPDVLNRSSPVRRIAGEPDFALWVFDEHSDPELPFEKRFARAAKRVGERRRLRLVPHARVDGVEELLEAERLALEAGYEGVMLRSLLGKYKHGRATEKEGTLWKLKRFTDGELTVLRFDEGEHNTNEQKRGEMGQAKRSSAKAGKVAAGVVGAMYGVWEGQEIKVAPGRLTLAQRAFYFQNPAKLIGRRIKFKTFEYGMKDKPRFANFQEFKFKGDE